MILKFLSLLTLCNGSYFSTTNLHEAVIDLPGRKYHFNGDITYVAERKDYDTIIKKLKKLEIFSYKVNDINVKTTIHRNNSEQDVKIDDEIAVTVASLTDWLFTTSFEKVCVLDETENSFLICLCANSQNIIDGYYRIKVSYISNQITINYCKVQNTITWFFKLITFFFKQKYINVNITSVKNTINFLSEKEEFKLEDVKFEIK